MSSSFPQLPLGASLIPMQATYGIVLVAVIISAFLTGILTLQLTAYYALFPNDSMIRKTLVSRKYLYVRICFLPISGWCNIVRRI